MDDKGKDVETGSVWSCKSQNEIECVGRGYGTGSGDSETNVVFG